MCRQDRTHIVRSYKQAVPNSRNEVITGIQDREWNPADDDRQESPDAPELLAELESAFGSCEHGFAGRLNQHAIGNRCALFEATLRLGACRSKRVAIQRGEAKSRASGVFREKETNRAMAESGCAVVENEGVTPPILALRKTGCDPCRIKCEKVQQNHSHAQVRKFDERHQSDVHA